MEAFSGRLEWSCMGGSERLSGRLDQATGGTALSNRCAGGMVDKKVTRRPRFRERFNAKYARLPRRGRSSFPQLGQCLRYQR
jgi:hypothetical protein